MATGVTRRTERLTRRAARPGRRAGAEVWAKVWTGANPGRPDAQAIEAGDPPPGALAPANPTARRGLRKPGPAATGVVRPGLRTRPDRETADGH